MFRVHFKSFSIFLSRGWCSYRVTICRAQGRWSGNLCQPQNRCFLWGDYWKYYTKWFFNCGPPPLCSVLKSENAKEPTRPAVPWNPSPGWPVGLLSSWYWIFKKSLQMKRLQVPSCLCLSFLSFTLGHGQTWQTTKKVRVVQKYYM